jgi:hypothetical protein
LNIGYNWDINTSQWIGDSKTEYAYDANGNRTLYSYSKWDTNLNQWVNNDKNEITYDANGNMTLNINYDWNKNTNQWVIYNKDEYTYDTNENRTSLITCLWDTLASQWINLAKTEYIYDINGNRIVNIGFDWDTDQWMLNFKGYHYYSIYSIISGINASSLPLTKLYPNPADEVFTLEIHDKSVNSCLLYNSNGQMIRILNINGSFNTYNISNLKAGLYIIKIPTQSGIIIRKMIKN